MILNLIMGGSSIFYRVVFAMCIIHIEFDKNANSTCIMHRSISSFIRNCLATIGVCIFCAMTAVVALFNLRECRKIRKGDDYGFFGSPLL